jgi:hypothetical protein
MQPIITTVDRFFIHTQPYDNPSVFSSTIVKELTSAPKLTSTDEGHAPELAMDIWTKKPEKHDDPDMAQSVSVETIVGDDNTIAKKRLYDRLSHDALGSSGLHTRSSGTFIRISPYKLVVCGPRHESKGDSNFALFAQGICS